MPRRVVRCVRIFPRPVRLFCVLALASLAASLASACSGGNASPTSPSSVSTSTGTGATGVTTYTYTTDIRPILNTDCTRCHNASQHEAGYDFTTYAGVLRALTPGNAQSLLVRATSRQGVMYPEFSGDRASKSQVFLDWVVSSQAAQ